MAFVNFRDRKCNPLNHMTIIETIKIELILNKLLYDELKRNQIRLCCWFQKFTKNFLGLIFVSQGSRSRGKTAMFSF